MPITCEFVPTLAEYPYVGQLYTCLIQRSVIGLRSGSDLEAQRDRAATPNYSAMKHLASSLQIDFSDSFVYMLTGYFDESGTHEQATVTTVAGFISTPERWEQFNEAWKGVLKLFGLSAFHMNECAHFVGEYAQFKNDEPGRRLLLTALAAVIQRTCLYGCAASVIRKDHAAINTSGLVTVSLSFPTHVESTEHAVLGNRLGSAYSIAAKVCMALGELWMKANDQVPPLDVLFESGCEFSRQFTRELETDERPHEVLNQFGAIAFDTRHRFPGLQAADFLAYEQCKYFTDCLKREGAVKPRVPLLMLKSIPHEWKLLDAYALGDLLITLVVNDLRQAGEIE